MEFFKKHFNHTDFDTPNNRGEVKVLCPFHDDVDPSANVNIDKELFHCYVCNLGMDEASFMSEVTGLDKSKAVALLSEISANSFKDWEITFKADLWADDDLLKHVEALQLSRETISKYGLGKAEVNNISVLAIPIFYNGSLMDIRRYNILKDKKLHKMSGNVGAKIGWVFPYDTWKETKDNKTYIFEGEKDTLLALELGINAICITGGAGTLPNDYTIDAFKGTEVVICYDNDEAGIKGSAKLANTLYDVCNTVEIMDMAQFVPDNKGDFHDYITKLGGDQFTFLMGETYPFEKQVVEKNYTSIHQALLNVDYRKSLTSKVLVTSEFSDVYSIPAVIEGQKTEDSDKSTMDLGQIESWTLNDFNVFQILPMIEVDAKATTVRPYQLSLLGIPPKERDVKISQKEIRFVYKTVITDLNTETSPVTLDLYSFVKPNVGSNYEIEYKMYPHPNKHQKLVAIATHVSEIGDNSDFKPIPALLSKFKASGSVEERLKLQFESAKHHVAKHMDYNIWLMTDLVFNSILDFDYDGVMRGALDVFLLGDTQVGKSETTSKLTELYNFGHFLSLKTSTTKGLIGGSNKVDGSWQSTVGAIPRQHKKLAILEEFSGAEYGFIKNMTDIRSSNMVRITRVGGELIVPCKLRMLTISNPLNDENGNPRNLSSFPNGVMPIMELIKSAEDVTRYDGFLLCPKPEGRLNPFTNRLTGTPIAKEAYEHRIQFSATRQPENVLFEDGVQEYIWEKAEIMNSLFESNVPIFGTTTSKKLARFSVAMASLLMNTDDFENLTVTKEIVDFVCDWLTEVYSSPYFLLDKVRAEYVEFTEFNASELLELQDLYSANVAMFEHLATSSKTNKGNLQSVSGHATDTFSVVFNSISELKLVRLDSYNIYPTEKFRRMYRELDKKPLASIKKYEDAPEPMSLERRN